MVIKDLVDVVYPDAEKIVLVVDNRNIHYPAALYERFKPDEARRPGQHGRVLSGLSITG